MSHGISARGTPEAIQERMISSERFEWTEVAGWIASDNAELNGAAFAALTASPPIVDGDVDPDLANGFLRDYLLLCIGNEERLRRAVIFEPPSPHIAAHSLSNWYRGLRAQGIPHTDEKLRRTREELKQLYLYGDDEQKRCIINGALEHIFESMRCRADFQDWEEDPNLNVAIMQAEEWADDHLATESEP